MAEDRFCRLLDEQYRSMVDQVVWPNLREIGFTRTKLGFSKIDGDRVLAISSCTSHQFFVMRATVGFSSVASFLNQAPPSAVYQDVIGPPPVHLRISLTGHQKGVKEGWALMDPVHRDPWWNPSDLNDIGPRVQQALREKAVPFFESAPTPMKALELLRREKKDPSSVGWIHDHVVRAAILELHGDHKAAQQEFIRELSANEKEGRPSGYGWLDMARNNCLLQFFRRRTRDLSAQSTLFGYYETGPYVGDAMIALRVDQDPDRPTSEKSSRLEGKELTDRARKDAQRGIDYALQSLRQNKLVHRVTGIELLHHTMLGEDWKEARLSYVMAMAVWNAFGFLPMNLPALADAGNIFPR